MQGIACIDIMGSAFAEAGLANLGRTYPEYHPDQVLGR